MGVLRLVKRNKTRYAKSRAYNGSGVRLPIDDSNSVFTLLTTVKVSTTCNIRLRHFSQCENVSLSFRHFFLEEQAKPHIVSGPSMILDLPEVRMSPRIYKPAFV